GRAGLAAAEELRENGYRGELLLLGEEPIHPYDRPACSKGILSGRQLPADGPVDEPGFHVLYGLSGAWALRQDLRDASRVAIIGGGLSGCETACTIRALARDCVIIDSNPGVMRRAIGAFASEYVTEAVRDDGVELRLGCRVQQVQRRR